MLSNVLSVLAVSLLSAAGTWLLSSFSRPIVAAIGSVVVPLLVSVAWVAFSAAVSTGIAREELIGWSPFIVGYLAVFSVPVSVVTLLIRRQHASRGA